MTEIELKLAVTPDDFARVKNALVAMAEGRQGSSSALSSTYYDTSFACARPGSVSFRR